jgi:hypothetical protein
MVRVDKDRESVVGVDTIEDFFVIYEQIQPI